MKARLLGVTVAVAVLSIQAANAASIANATSGLATPDVFVDFGNNLFPNGTLITDQFATQGVTFINTRYYTNGGINLFDGFLTGALYELSYHPLEIDFLELVSAATFVFQDVNTSTAVFSAFLGGSLVETFTASADQISSNNYYGFSGIVFDRILVGNIDNFNMDNLAYDIATPLTTTPLPAALPLFATGLGALGLLGWRRKRKNAAAIAA